MQLCITQRIVEDGAIPNLHSSTQLIIEGSSDSHIYEYFNYKFSVYSVTGIQFPMNVLEDIFWF